AGSVRSDTFFRRNETAGTILFLPAIVPPLAHPVTTDSGATAVARSTPGPQAAHARRLAAISSRFIRRMLLKDRKAITPAIARCSCSSEVTVSLARSVRAKQRPAFRPAASRTRRRGWRPARGRSGAVRPAFFRVDTENAEKVPV